MMGGYDLEKFSRPGEQIEWLDLKQTNYWSLELNAAALETEDGEDQFGLDTWSKIAILDSGTSYMLMPSYDFALITSKSGEFGLNL